MKARQVKTLVVGIVAAHSIILGAAMLFWPAGTMDLFGWEHEGGTFYPSQAGVFLLLLGAAYAVGARQRSFAVLLVVSKIVAVGFLLTQYFRGVAPSAAVLAAIGDGTMGVVVAVVLAWETSSEARATGPGGEA